MGKQRDLVIPPEAFQDSAAGEVLRAWVAKGDLHCSLRPSIWDDPGNWGILLAVVARHVARALEKEVARALEKEKERDPLDTLQRIRQAFVAEMDYPTAEPGGGHEHRH